MRSEKGIVYLVGAGPGDPALLTLKGRWCLEQADVVVYDRLVSEYLLTMCRNDAKLIYVGKETDSHAVPQSGINQLLAELAGKGNIVCRLKGGDPFVFGRGGEEASYLAVRDIPFEIVPGVTAAVAVPAYAGIPITHRDYAANFSVATGHRRTDGRFVRDTSTKVFLMGFENLEAIVREQLAEGREPETPAALVYWGTRAEQQTVTGTLKNIRERALAAGIGPPSLLIIGEVVSLREKLKWREKKPLFGKRILITRPRLQGQALAEKIMLLGGEPLCLPVIDPVLPDDLTPLDSALAALTDYDWIIFTSANGVAFFLQRMFTLKIDIRKMRGEIAAIGPVTAAALARTGLQVAYIPQEYRAEALLAGLLARIPAGSRVLLPRAAAARPVLPEGLRDKGIDLNVIPAYKIVSAGKREWDVVKAMRSKVDLIIFTSSSTVKNFVRLAGDELKEITGKSRVACIGPVTAATAQDFGIKVDLVAKEYTADGLLDEILTEAGVS